MDDLDVETITPEIAGKILHKSAEFIRAGLRQEKFEFGTAVLGKTGQWNYIIIKSKFLSYVGMNKNLEEDIKNGIN